MGRLVVFAMFLGLVNAVTAKEFFTGMPNEMPPRILNICLPGYLNFNHFGPAIKNPNVQYLPFLLFPYICPAGGVSQARRTVCDGRSHLSVCSRYSVCSVWMCVDVCGVLLSPKRCDNPVLFCPQNDDAQNARPYLELMVLRAESIVWQMRLWLNTVSQVKNEPGSAMTHFNLVHRPVTTSDLLTCASLSHRRATTFSWTSWSPLFSTTTCMGYCVPFCF